MNYPRFSAVWQADPISKQPPPFSENLAFGEDPEKNLWLFWDSFTSSDGTAKTFSDFQHLCFQTIHRNKGSFRLYVITLDNARGYLDAAPPATSAHKKKTKYSLPTTTDSPWQWFEPNSDSIIPAQQKDMILFSLLAKYGGIAIDLSFILLPNRLDLIWDSMKFQKQDSSFWLRTIWFPHLPWFPERIFNPPKEQNLLNGWFWRNWRGPPYPLDNSIDKDHKRKPGTPGEFSVVWLIFARRFSKVFDNYHDLVMKVPEIWARYDSEISEKIRKASEKDAEGGEGKREDSEEYQYHQRLDYFGFGCHIFDQLLWPVYKKQQTFQGRKAIEVFPKRKHETLEKEKKLESTLTEGEKQISEYTTFRKNFHKIAWRDLHCSACDVRIDNTDNNIPKDSSISHTQDSHDEKKSDTVNSGKAKKGNLRQSSKSKPISEQKSDSNTSEKTQEVKSGHGDSRVFPAHLRWNGEFLGHDEEFLGFTLDWLKFREEDACFAGPVPRHAGVKFFQAGGKIGQKKMNRREILDLNSNSDGVSKMFHLAGIRDYFRDDSFDNSAHTTLNEKEIQSLLSYDPCTSGGVIFTRTFFYVAIPLLFCLNCFLVWVIWKMTRTKSSRTPRGHRHSRLGLGKTQQTSEQERSCCRKFKSDGERDLATENSQRFTPTKSEEKSILLDHFSA